MTAGGILDFVSSPLCIKRHNSVTVHLFKFQFGALLTPRCPGFDSDDGVERQANRRPWYR